MTNGKLAQYVDRVFLPYEDVQQVKELKEELLRNLEKYSTEPRWIK